MERLDNNATLANPTDAEVDTAVGAAWARIISAQSGS
jgi:hemin uptake protein HemP